ncbi:hypothetical protein GUJ93_ZPchr0010g10393 [Zizania palustris]|uniref:CUE domain-containing protein n=1 Tax=Zizania palustris TaxID=103762 RepID=A0A8J5W9V9_ZIZPA|nr:hypothetical protein GUJ93_ZPchr0010g10393 [Zizania palustris]
MGDHKAVFRSLQELFPQVDPRILNAVAIEHRNDVDSAVMAILDEVMPSVMGTSSVIALPAHQEIGSSKSASVGTSSAPHHMYESGNSFSAGHDKQVDAVDRSVHSTEITTDRQENVLDELDAGTHSSYQQMSEQLNLPSHPVLEELNDIDHYLTMDLNGGHLNPCSKGNLSHLENEVGLGHGGYLLNEYLDQILIGESGNASTIGNVSQVQEQDSDNAIPVEDCAAQDDSLNLCCDYVDVSAGNNSFSKSFSGVSNNEVSYGINGTDDFSCVLDILIPDTRKSSIGHDGEQDTISSGKADLIPDINLIHLASIASTHSSHSVSIESLEDSITDAKSNKNDLLPSLELVTKMLEDVEILEEKAKVAKCESSIAGTNILTKVEELKEMLNHAKEANDMHAGEVFGEKSILTTEARELQSRLQRLSDERNNYLVVIEEIRQTLEDRLVAAQREIDAAEKERIEKEASAQALLDEQEKEMNSIVEESRKLQKESEENLKLLILDVLFDDQLKDFLVERGRIVDTLQGEMAVICEDVFQLKQIVDERLSFGKLQRSTISSLHSSLQSSLHKSGCSADRAIEALESTDKHTVAESASPVVGDQNGSERSVQVLDDSGMTGKDDSKRGENEDGWELC